MVLVLTAEDTEDAEKNLFNLCGLRALGGKTIR
jgi:hypothetical protein